MAYWSTVGLVTATGSVVTYVVKSKEKELEGKIEGMGKGLEAAFEAVEKSWTS